MRRAVAPLLLALAIVSPLLAQSAARRDGANHEATPDRRRGTHGCTYSATVTRISAPGTSTATVRRRLRISAG